MQSAEVLVQETFLMAASAQQALEQMQKNNFPAAQETLSNALKRFNSCCQKNAMVDALVTLLDGFQPPATYPIGMPAMRNPL